MSAADILAAARANPLSPVVPAREEWLRGWIGPALAPTGAGNGDYTEVAVVELDRGRAYWYNIGAVRFDFGDVDDVRLDLRRREVRHRLVDCGVLPASLRDHVAAAVAAGLGVHVRFALGSWEPVRSASLDNRGVRWGIPRRTECFGLHGPRGWELYLDGREPAASGPEEGMVGARTGRLAVDLAALSRGCVLEEADGWYVPLPSGAVGWLPREA